VTAHLTRPLLSPAIDDPSIGAAEVLEHLRAVLADTTGTVERLRAHRQTVDEERRRLENPNAAIDHLDFFVDLFDRARADLAAVIARLTDGGGFSEVDTLRQIASNGAAEQRRCLVFQDKWINKPLPFEQQRALLKAIVNDTRAQLADYRALGEAAARLRALSQPERGEGRDGHVESPGRRALFTRWFGR
jgi:hypothetical protein